MSSNLPPINRIAEILGGDVTGAQALAPGPGHSAKDRSLAIKLDSAAPDGFVVHSFADDDPIACRDFVKKKLGPLEFIPKKKTPNGGGRPFSPTVAKYVYRLADDKPYLQVERTAAKEFFQYHWNGENWKSGKPKGPKIPYMLPHLIAATPTTPIYVVEGEKDADNLAKIGFVATCNSEGADNGSGGKWTPDLNQYFRDRDVYIIPDNDALGRKHAEHVARNLDPVAKSVRIVDLPNLAPKGDVSDWLRSDTAGAKLSELAKAAPLWAPRETTSGIASDEKLIVELAGLSKLAYAKRRKRAAEDMGIGVGELDRIAAEVRGDGSDDKAAPALYEHWAVQAASDPIDGGILLRALTEQVQRYVFMSKDLAVAVALWIVFSWLHESLTHSPLLYVTSAERDSGKSTLLGVLNFLTRRSLQSVDISGPSLFRSIAKWQPTLIVDEADDALADNPDLRSVINSGWTRGQGVMRCHPAHANHSDDGARFRRERRASAKHSPSLRRKRGLSFQPREGVDDDHSEGAPENDHADDRCGAMDGAWRRVEAATETRKRARQCGPDAVAFLHYVLRTDKFASATQRVRAASVLLEVGEFLSSETKETGLFREAGESDDADASETS